MAHQNITLLGHEVGHYLGLKHTFAKEFDSIADARDRFVASGRDPAVFDGDRLSDTPPDPQMKDSCDTSPTLTLDGTVFPLPRDNAMAYHDSPVKTLTAQQGSIVRSTLLDRVARHGLEVRASMGSSLSNGAIGTSAVGLGIEPASPEAPAPAPPPRRGAITTTTTPEVETVVTAAPPVAGLGMLYARLSRRDNGAPLSGQTIVMSTSSGTVCQGVTNADGRTGCSGLFALAQIGLDNGYTATFDGAGDLLGASARATLLASSASRPATAVTPSTTTTTTLAGTPATPSTTTPTTTAPTPARTASEVRPPQPRVAVTVSTTTTVVRATTTTTVGALAPRPTVGTAVSPGPVERAERSAVGTQKRQMPEESSWSPIIVASGVSLAALSLVGTILFVSWRRS